MDNILGSGNIEGEKRRKQEAEDQISFEATDSQGKFLNVLLSLVSNVIGKAFEGNPKR